MSVTSFASKPLMIERQGQFPVGGTTITRPGTFDPDTFTGWTNPVQDGQTYRCDHAFARYQIPTDARKLPCLLSFDSYSTLYIGAASIRFEESLGLTRNILISYKIHIGKDTRVNVNISDVGVMIAAIIRIITIACFLYLRMNPFEIKPSFPKSQQSTGISNTIPIAIHIISRVPI